MARNPDDAPLWCLRCGERLSPHEEEDFVTDPDGAPYDGDPLCGTCLEIIADLASNEEEP